MSRHRKQRPFGQPTPAPAAALPPAHLPPPSANGATAPDGDTTAELLALRAYIEETRHELNTRLDALSQSVERLLHPHLDAPVEHAPPRAPAGSMPVGPAPVIRVGEEVYVPHLGGTFTVVEATASGRMFKVQAGAVRVQVRIDEVWPLEDGQPNRQAGGGRSGVKGARPPHPEMRSDILEIDLHGYSEADALITLELFLHHAFAQGTRRIRIIHGKGNGTLRAAVRRELARHALVHTVDSGPQYRGDDGVTLAELDV